MRSTPEVGTADSLQEYGRGIAGGFLFSLPLLLTMELWAAGAAASPARLLAGLVATFVLLCGYNAYAGLRHDSTLAEIVIDSVEELGLGIVLSAVILVLLAGASVGMDARDTLGTIITQGLMVAIGVSVGTAQISGDRQQQGGPEGRHLTLISEIVLALCGTVLVAANVAPTEEIVLLAGRMRPGHLLAVMALSLALAAMLLYHSNFAGSARFAGSHHWDVLHGATITYAAALAGSAGLLWFFRRFDSAAPHLAIAQCVVLGLPGTLGAAVGRLLLR